MVCGAASFGGEGVELSHTATEQRNRKTRTCSVSRLLSAVMEQHARLFVNKTPKGDYRYAWGINFPKELAPFDVPLVVLSKQELLHL